MWTSQKMLNEILRLHIISQKEHYLQERKLLDYQKMNSIRNNDRTCRIEIQSYLTDDNDKDKKTKDTKKCVIKRKFENYKYEKLKFEDQKDCSKATHLKTK